VASAGLAIVLIGLVIETKQLEHRPPTRRTKINSRFRPGQRAR
jgi:hypothetical protein